MDKIEKIAYALKGYEICDDCGKVVRKTMRHPDDYMFPRRRICLDCYLKHTLITEAMIWKRKLI